MRLSLFRSRPLAALLTVVALVAFFARIPTTYAAVAFDAGTWSAEGSVVTSRTWSHGGASSLTNGIVIVCVVAEDSTTTDRDVQGVTFRGSAMTLIGESDNDDDNISATAFYIKSSTGTGQVIVTMNGGTVSTLNAAAVSYSGVDQTTPVEASTFGDQTISGHNQGTMSVSVTTITANAWLAGCVGQANSTGVTSRSGTARIVGDGLSSYVEIQDQDVASPGATNTSVTASSSLSDWALVGFAIKPAAAAPPAAPVPVTGTADPGAGVTYWDGLSSL